MLVRLGRVPEALDHLRRAIKDDPRYALAHYNLANILTKDGYVAEGTREYLETIRVAEPDDARLRQMAFDHLRELRKTIAAEQDIAAFVVFSDVTLRELAAVRPSTVDAFRTIRGVGYVLSGA